MGRWTGPGRLGKVPTMAKHVVLQDWSGEIGSLPAGEVLDDAHYNVEMLRKAGVAHVPFEDGMQPFIDVFLQVSRGHNPNVQLLPILRAAGFLSGAASEPLSGVLPVHSGATLILTAAHHNQRIPVNTAANGVVVQVGTGLFPGFRCELRRMSALNAISYAAGAGFITPVAYGLPSTAVNTLISIAVESATHAEVVTVGPT